jgi:hypothetical protein
MKSGNLKFLEPSGPLQACNGADCFTFQLIKIHDMNIKTIGVQQATDLDATPSVYIQIAHFMAS